MATTAQPQHRARAGGLSHYDDNSPIKVLNSTALAALPSCIRRIFRGFTFSICVRALMAAEDWPIDYDTLAPFFAENDR